MTILNIKSAHSQTLLSRLPYLPISVDYEILARLKIDWTCQILNLSSLLPIHFFTIYDWYIYFKVFFCILLDHQCNSATWFFTSSHLLKLFVSFFDSWGQSNSISLHFLLFPMVLRCKFKMSGRYILLIQIFRLSNNKNSIKFVKLK